MNRIIAVFSCGFGIPTVAVVAFWCGANVAYGVRNWNVGSGNWSLASNWTPSGTPASSEATNIVFTNGVARTVNYDFASPALGLVTIDLTGAGTTTNTLSIPNNLTLQAAAIFVGGYNGITGTATSGRGDLNQSNGLVAMSSGTDLVVGYGVGSTGTYELSNTGAFTASQSEFIGYSGTGTLTQSGGTNTINPSSVGSLDIGALSGASGHYYLTSGILSSNMNEYVGDAGAGTFLQSGGSNSIAGAGHNLYLGNASTGTGTYTLSGTAALTVGNDLIVGNSGTGTMNIQLGSSVSVADNVTVNSLSAINLSGGLLRFNTFTNLNRLNYTSGTIQLAGNRNPNGDPVMTTLFPGAGFEVKIPASKKLVVEGSTLAQFYTITADAGAFASLGELDLGSSAGVGYIKVIDGGAVATGADCVIDSGNSGINLIDGVGSMMTVLGNLTLKSGDLSVQNQGSLYVAGNISATTTAGGLAINLSGGTLRMNTETGGASSFSLNHLHYSSGTIQLSGDRNISTDGTIGNLFGSSPSIPTGKQLTVEGTATFGASTNMTLAGGKFAAGTIVMPLGSQITTTASSTVSGALLGDTGSVVNATGGDLTIGDATKVNGFYTNGSLFVGAHAVTLADANDAVLDSASLVTLGNSTSAGTLNAANGLTVNFGGNITGFGSILSTNSITTPVINNGHISGTNSAQKITLNGYVKGVGTFGNVNFSGTFSPGLSPSIVQTSNMSLASTSTLVMELGSTTVGSGYDQIQDSGSLTLGGTLQVSLISGFTPSAGNSFDLFNWNSESGTFSSLNLPLLSTGLTWNTSQLYTTGVISVSAAGIAGDYNNNGIVDAADYVVWRSDLGTTTVLPNDPTGGLIGTTQYNTWRSHFGQTAGSGAGAIPGVAVPEPTTLLPIILGVAVIFVRRRRSASVISKLINI